MPFVAVLALALWPSVFVSAQTEAPTAAATTVDEFGNARRFEVPNRRVGFHQSEAQGDATQGFQLLGRRLQGAGGFGRVSLPTDMLSVTNPRLFQFALPESEMPPRLRAAYERYGGFGQRAGVHRPEDVPALFARRYALIEATAHHAAVRRSLWKTGPSAAGLRASMRSTPAAPQKRADLGAPPTLDQFLVGGAARTYLSSREQGWSLFREKEYRRAARAFESASLIQPLDFESRLGELFCHVSVGFMRTAAASAAELAVRDSNPFAHKIAMADKFSDPAEARLIRTRAKAAAQAAPEDEAVWATYALVLWYLGDADEAMLTGDLRGGFRESPHFADWPQKMRAAADLRKQAAEPASPVKDVP